MKDPRKFWRNMLAMTLSTMTVVFLWPMREGTGFSWKREMFADLVHMTAYAILTYVLVNFLVICRNTKSPFVMTSVVAIGYGVFIEVMQRAVPGRSSSLSDVCVNTLGIILMIVAIKKEIFRISHLRSGAVSV